MAEAFGGLLAELETHFGAAAKPADYHRFARRLRAAAPPELTPLRVGFLASFTLDFAASFLTVEAARQGYLLEPYFGPFGQFEQEVANPSSGLHTFEPDAVVMALRLEDVDPDAIARRHAPGGGARLVEAAGELPERLCACVDALRRHRASPVLVANFVEPELGFGMLGANASDSLGEVLATVTGDLRAGLTERSDAYVWDYAGLVRGAGVAAWTDPRLWAIGRIAVAASQQPVLARHLVRSLRALHRAPAKCLVLDLDNTLWGGVIGEDGPEGIALSDDHPGSAYKAFQREALALKDRGILLAIASKNEPDDVDWVLRHHPEMLIRWDDIAAFRVNWQPKSANLRELADELNIGSDALVFFDDNPVERAEVRANAPEVCVVEVPRDPLRYVAALRDVCELDAASLSDEDRVRTDLYQAERTRGAARTQFGTLDEFLASLQMTAELGDADAATLGRVTQLIGKTNQFNLTTRRYAKAEVEVIAKDETARVRWLRLRDRHGDLGIVAVGILRAEGEDARIDVLLMSCRVMGRGVEQALLCDLADAARALGCRSLLGEFLPTAKNAVASAFYPDAGFAPVASLGDGGEAFRLDLEAAEVAWPGAIERVVPTDPA